MGELGIMGISVPEEYGGAGLGFIERAIVVEEIARHAAGLALGVESHLVIAYILNIYGTEEQKKKYLPDIASGNKICSISVTEPSGGSDMMGLKSTGEKKDGKWVLNGRKCFITNSLIADLDLWLVRTGTDEKNRPLLSMFIIEKETPGHKAGRKEDKFGLRGVPTGDILCENVVLDDSQLIGKEGSGAKIAMDAFSTAGRSGMSAICVGLLRACYEEAVKFAKERMLYGKPLAKIQAIQNLIAENRVDYETAKLLTYSATALTDEGKPNGVEITMAKYYTAETAARAAKRTMDLMGGYGVINEYPVSRYLRDALTSIPAGATSMIMQVVIAGDSLKG